MIQIRIASLDSDHFHFDAIGIDEESAIKELKAGLRAHAIRYKITADWFESGDFKIRTRWLSTGCTYRDGEEI